MAGSRWGPAAQVSAADEPPARSSRAAWPRRLLRQFLAYGMEAATIIVMVVEVVIVAAGVFCRYILGRPIAGSDEIATLMLGWLTLLGGAVAQRRQASPHVSLFVQHLCACHHGLCGVYHPADRGHLLRLRLLVQSGPVSELGLGEASAGAGFDMSLYPMALSIGVTASLLLTIGQLATRPPRALIVVLGGGWVGLGQPEPWSSTARGSRLFDYPCHSGVDRRVPGAAGVEHPAGSGAGVPRTRGPATPGRGAPSDAAPAPGPAGADNFVLLAIPLFILAGQLMETGGSVAATGSAGACAGWTSPGWAGACHRRGRDSLFWYFWFHHGGCGGHGCTPDPCHGAGRLQPGGGGRDRKRGLGNRAILVPPCLLPMVILATIAECP